MDVGLQQRAERIVHQAMPLYQRHAGEDIRHDPQPKVPFAATTGVARVRRAVVANLQLDRMESILHHRSDPFNPRAGIAGAAHGAVPR